MSSDSDYGPFALIKYIKKPCNVFATTCSGYLSLKYSSVIPPIIFVRLATTFAFTFSTAIFSN